MNDIYFYYFQGETERVGTQCLHKITSRYERYARVSSKEQGNSSVECGKVKTFCNNNKQVHVYVKPQQWSKPLLK